MKFLDMRIGQDDKDS